MKKKKYLVVLFLILTISIGYALISSNLTIGGLSIVKRTTWDIHFERIVDDIKGAEAKVNAKISQDRKSINFEVNLKEPGEEYYFYTDVVNDGNLDAMLDLFELDGLSDEQKKYIEWEVEYADGIQLKKYDLLRGESEDTLKVIVRFKEDVQAEDLPTIATRIALTFSATYIQADERATPRTYVDDVTPPKIQFIKLNDNQGNGAWSKDIRLLVKVVDQSKIKETKYCITTPDNECVPDTVPEEVNNGSFNFTFPESDEEQRICVKATDVKENSVVTCSTERYLVDGEDPIIKNVNVTKDTNNITIEVDAEDRQSGLSMYYFSKDSGKNYIASLNPNYTFTGLDNDDYMITIYVEDVAGNVSAVNAQPQTVRSGEWCKKNGLTTLGDCLIAQEARTANLNLAKEKIKEKTKPILTNMAPAISYVERESAKASSYSYTYTITYYQDGTKYTSSNLFYSTNYTFNKSTGKFSLKSYTNTANLETLDLENNIYYTCSNFGSWSECNKLYRIVSLDNLEEIDRENANYKYHDKKYTVTKYEIDPKTDGYDSSNTGMYSIPDDYGDSFYYRGAASGNIVKFGDYYWKVIRVNGDGTIRMIYYGNSPTTPNTIESPSFNLSYGFYDPTYLGFMYNDDEFSTEPYISTSGGGYTDFNDTNNNTYYFSKSYSYDSDTKKFKLDKSEDNLISGKWREIRERVLNEGYLYTFGSTNIDYSTGTLYKIYEDEYYEVKAGTNYYRVRYRYITKGSTSYENATKNVKKSNIMLKLENWYNQNIAPKNDANNKSLEDYLADSIFCNDRTLHQGNGYYGYDTRIYYKPYNRINVKSPSLVCLQDNDKFTASALNGNGALDKKVGLITADEVQLAGIMTSSSYNNKLVYLFWNNKSYWTMSPHSSYSGADYIYNVTDSNWLDYNQKQNGYGLRPVINLKANTKIVSGEGTEDSPFEITLGN